MPPKKTLQTPTKLSLPDLLPITSYSLPQLTTLAHNQYSIDISKHNIPQNRILKKQYIYNLIESTIHKQQTGDLQQWGKGWNESVTIQPSPRSPRNLSSSTGTGNKKRKSKSITRSDSDNESGDSINGRMKSPVKRRASHKHTTDESNYIDPELLDVPHEHIDAMSIDDSEEEEEESDSEKYSESKPRKSLQPNEFQSSLTDSDNNNNTVHSIDYTRAASYHQPSTIQSRRTTLTQPMSRYNTSPNTASVTVPTLDSRFTQPIVPTAQQSLPSQSMPRQSKLIDSSDGYYEQLLNERMKPTYEQLRSSRKSIVHKTPPLHNSSNQPNTINLTQPDISRLSLQQSNTSFTDIIKPGIVQSPEPIPYIKPTKHIPYTVRSLLQYIIPLLLLLLLTFIGVTLHNNPSLYSHYPFFWLEPYTRPFCSSSIAEPNRYPLLGKKLCLPCPRYGICTHGNLYCTDLYQRSGDICMESKKLHNKIGYYSDIAVDILQRHKGHVECNEYNMTDDTISAGLTENELIDRLIHIDHDIENNDIVIHKTLNALQHRNDVFSAQNYYVAIEPTYSYTCAVRKYIQSHIFECTAATTILSFVSYILYKFNQCINRRQRRNIVLQQVYDYMQSYGGIQSIDYIRRDLNVTDSYIWNYVVQQINNDTRVQKSQHKFGQVIRDSWEWVNRRTSRKPLTTIQHDIDNDVIMNNTESNYLTQSNNDHLHVSVPNAAQQYDRVNIQPHINKKSGCIIC